MTVLWDDASCSLIEVYRRFRSAYCLHHQVALMMEVISTSETSVNFTGPHGATSHHHLQLISCLNESPFIFRGHVTFNNKSQIDHELWKGVTGNKICAVYFKFIYLNELKIHENLRQALRFLAMAGFQTEYLQNLIYTQWHWHSLIYCNTLLPGICLLDC
jgi:hypothetical protein